MKILGFNINITRAEAPVRRSLSISPGMDWLTGGSGETGGATMTNAYQQVVWVYRAINVLAEQVANIPFLFSTGGRGRENLITSGSLLDFYARPHPQINAFEYWELRVIWLMLRGECFRVPIYSDARNLDPNRDRNLSSTLSAPGGAGLGEVASSLTHSLTHSHTHSGRRRTLERIV